MNEPCDWQDFTAVLTDMGVCWAFNYGRNTGSACVFHQYVNIELMENNDNNWIDRVLFH